MKISEAPLIVFDVETTGVDVNEARIVEFGAALFELAAAECPHAHPRHTVVRRRSLVNPGIPIPPEASAIHHIDDAAVVGAPSFAQLIDKLVPWFEGRRPVGFNAVRYDVPLIAAELARAGLAIRMHDEAVLDPSVFANWTHRGERSRKLVDVAALYNVLPSRGAAHSAAVDCQMTGELLLAMVRDGAIPDDVDEALALQADLAKRIEEEFDTFSYWIYRCRKGTDGGPLRIGAGKYCGALVENVDPGYFDYMIEKATDLTPATRAVFEARSHGRAA